MRRKIFSKTRLEAARELSSEANRRVWETLLIQSSLLCEGKICYCQNIHSNITSCSINLAVPLHIVHVLVSFFFFFFLSLSHWVCNWMSKTDPKTEQATTEMAFLVNQQSAMAYITFQYCLDSIWPSGMPSKGRSRQASRQHGMEKETNKAI